MKFIFGIMTFANGDINKAYGAAGLRGGTSNMRGGMKGSNRDYPLPYRPNRKGVSFGNAAMRKDSPNLGGGGHGGGMP